MKETLEDVEKFMASKGLARCVANFSHPFNSLLKEKEMNYLDYNNDEIDYDKLKEDYDYIKNYEEKMSGRILDHRYIEVVNELILLSQKKPHFLDIDVLSNIYKHEYEDIIKNLEIIQDALTKIPTFKESVWRVIPTINAISSSDQIITLVNNIKRCFEVLEEERRILQDKYLLANINDYGRLKNIIYNIENLNIEYIPDSWKENKLKNFEAAENEYKELKNDIYTYQEVDYNLSHKFANLETLSIDDEVKFLLGSFYNSDDLDNINHLLENRNNITARINRGLYQKDNYEKDVFAIESFAGWNFHDDDEAINEILKLADFLNENNISRRLINIVTGNQYEVMYQKLVDCINSIDSANKGIDDFQNKHPKFSDNNWKELKKTIDEYSNLSLEEKKENNRITVTLKKRLGSNHLEEVVHDITKYFSDLNTTKQKKEDFFDIIKEKYSPDNKAIERLKSLKDFISNVKKNISTNVVKFLYKITDKDNNFKDDSTRIIRTLSNFKKSYYELEDLCSVLETYGIPFNKTHFSSKVKDIDVAVDYIKNLYASNDRMKNIVKNKDLDYVTAENYLQLQNYLKVKNDIKSRLLNNQRYLLLYGKLYQEEKTDITLISRIMQMFKDFYKCFKRDGYIKALDKDINSELISHMEVCRKETEELNEIFKLYCRIFKDGVSLYYYSTFVNCIEHLDKLANSEDELSVYLTITKSIAVLDKYKLKKLINYIINDGDSTNLVDNFKYTYFKCVESIYLENNPELRNRELIIQKLGEVIDLESALIKINENVIISSIQRDSNKTNFEGIKNLDYQGYIAKNDGSIRVFLTSTDIANLYLDYNAFDLILIDDAHLLAANEYGDFINGNQVIVAGEYQLHASISNSLISRTRNYASILLDYRYLPVPKNLLKHFQELNGLIKNEYHENVGMEIVETDHIGYIYNLYLKNKNVSINYFTKGIKKQRAMYEEIASYFTSKKVNHDEIIAFLMNKINICDLNEGYLYNADYNIIDFEDYYDIDIDYISDNLISYLLLCKEKVVVYDRKSLINQENDYKFFNAFIMVLNSHNKIFNEKNDNVIMKDFSNCLTVNKSVAYVDRNNLIFRTESEEKMAAILVLWGNSSTSETLNTYRDVYISYLKNNWSIQVITKNYLVNDMELLALELRKGKYEQKRK